MIRLTTALLQRAEERPTCRVVASTQEPWELSCASSVCGRTSVSVYHRTLCRHNFRRLCPHNRHRLAASRTSKRGRAHREVCSICNSRELIMACQHETISISNMYLITHRIHAFIATTHSSVICLNLLGNSCTSFVFHTSNVVLAMILIRTSLRHIMRHSSVVGTAYTWVFVVISIRGQILPHLSLSSKTRPGDYVCLYINTEVCPLNRCINLHSRSEYT